jgi:uncharacterized protein YjbI with pentapeptide repeats
LSKPPRTPYPPDLAEDAQPPTQLGDLADAVLSELDCAGHRFPRLELRRVELRTCRLTGAELGEATLTDTVFRDCQLDLAGFRHATLTRVRFSDCRLEEVELQHATLTDVLFERCSLRATNVSSARCQRIELRDCDLTALVGVDSLRRARMTVSDVLANAPVFAAALEIEIVE